MNRWLPTHLRCAPGRVSDLASIAAQERAAARWAYGLLRELLGDISIQRRLAAIARERRAGYPVSPDLPGWAICIADTLSQDERRVGRALKERLLDILGEMLREESLPRHERAATRLIASECRVRFLADLARELIRGENQ
jgi:hypothetical protein